MKNLLFEKHDFGIEIGVSVILVDASVIKNIYLF
jgi:hypothetical protein